MNELNLIANAVSMRFDADSAGIVVTASVFAVWSSSSQKPAKKTIYISEFILTFV